jgi:hypothetical protein
MSAVPLEGTIRQSASLLFGSGEAVFSTDMTYRYQLTRRWAGGPGAVWIMLNPSTADAMKDDPTLGRCIAFTREWDLAGLTVVNLFALRATDPHALAGHPDPCGPENDDFIREAIGRASVLVAAWGAHKLAASRAAHVLKLVADAGLEPMCLGVTKDGYPKHPLARGRAYIPAGTKPVPFGGDAA